MSDTSKDAEIDVHVDEKPVEKEEIEVVASEKDDKSSVSVEEGIQDLKLRLEQERLARADAERRAREAAEREAVAKNKVDETNLQLVSNAIETV